MDAELRKLTSCFIYLAEVNGKKSPFGLQNKGKTGWSLEKATTEMEMEAYQGTKVLGVARVIKLKDIVCIDIDDPVITYDQIIQLYPFLSDTCYVKGNTKGFHFYVGATYPKNNVDCFTDIKGDIIVDQMFELEGKEWKNDIQDITQEQLLGMCNETDTESVSSSVSSSSVSSVSGSLTPFYRSILDNIKPSLYTSYPDWKKFIGACRYFDNGLDVANEYSSRIAGYISRADVEKHMTYTTSVGYLMNLSRKSNPIQYKIILGEKYLKEDLAEYQLGQIAMYLTDDIIKVEDKLYYYDVYWRLDATKNEAHTRMLVCSLLRTFFKFHHDRALMDLSNTDNDEDYKLKRKQVDKLHSIMKNKIDTTASKNIIDQFRVYLPSQQVQFDTNPYLFCFNNCAFDLQTGKQVTVLKEDYVLQTTSTDYIAPTPAQTTLVEKLLVQIFPDAEIRKSYLSILFSGMTGIRVERFFLANGCGRNGKGLLNELFMELLGQYGYILPSSVLTSKADISTGANPVIANCHKKRFILSREPEEGAKIRTCIIKEMTGGCEINARQLYSGNCKVTMCQTQMLECNAKPALNGTMNEAVLERIVDVPFNSCFTSDASLVNEDKHIHLVNTDYKLETFRKQHASALFHVLLQHKKLYIPQSITIRSREYVLSSDDIYVWVKDNYEECDGFIVKAVDLYKDYTASDTFLTMSKEERRLMTKAKVVGILKASIAFKGKYFEDKKMIKGIRYSERLEGWKKKVDEIENEPSDI